MAAERFEAPLLDPFAFPSETKGRFMMLIMAALACGAHLGIILYVLLFGSRYDKEGQAKLEPFLQQSWGKTVFSYSISGMKSLAQQEAVEARHSLAIFAGHLILPCLTLLVLVIWATISYRNHPKRLRLRYRARPLAKAEAPMVVADLEACAERFGICLPNLEYSSGLAQGHAFGIEGSDVLLLHGTPAMLEKSWGPANRAIALHELAHIANGDSYEREKARSLWRPLVIVFLGGIILLWRGRTYWPGFYFFQAIATLIFVRALWAGLIRTREFYADWRVASWGEGENLRSLFTMPEREGAPWERWTWWWAAWERWGDRSWWNPAWTLLAWIWRHTRWLLRLHPSFRTRHEILMDSRHLFGISPDLPFLTGTLLTLVAAGSFMVLFFFLNVVVSMFGLLHSLFLGFVSDLSSRTWRELLLVGANITMVVTVLVFITVYVFIVSYLITKTIGVQVQKKALADIIHARAKAWGYAHLLPTAFLFALGTEVGLHIVPLNIFSFASKEIWMATPVWLVSFTILLWLWLAYVHGLSRMLLGSYIGQANPRLRQTVVTWSSVGLLTTLYWPALLARVTLQALPLAHAKGYMLIKFEPRKVFIYGLFNTTLLVLVFSLIVYAIWVLASIAVLRLGPLRQRRFCPTCREEIHFMLGLGRGCQSCGGSLTPWILAYTSIMPIEARVRT